MYGASKKLLHCSKMHVYSITVCELLAPGREPPRREPDERRDGFNWSRFNELLKRHPLPVPRIVHRYIAVSEALP